MSRHRQDVRPRYGRIAVAGVSCAITAIAVLGGVGLIPLPGRAATQADAAYKQASSPQSSAGPATTSGPSGPAGSPDADLAEDGGPTGAESSAPGDASGTHVATDSSTPDESLPAGSGSGRRVVFSESRQRVWLVTGKDHVQRTYVVSGSRYDNLDPGTYAVYSRSENAWGVDGSTMEYFVRFTQGDHAAIGFHTIPLLNGSQVQTKAQLGTPLSHGCIRQKQVDAKAMWSFAQMGTTVVVTA